MGATCKVIINKNFVRSDGTSAISLRIIINRAKKEIPLNLTWPLDKFDYENGLCQPRKKPDQDAEDNNIIIRTEIAKVNEIFKYYRLIGQSITMDKFLKDYNNELSKTDLIKYINKKIRLRFKDREIAATTYDAHFKTFRKLQAWKPEILFRDLDEKWGYDFDAYLAKNIKSRGTDSTNTRWMHHKTIKAYLKLARRDQIRFVNPYEFFSITPVQGNWRPVFEADFLKLYEYYKNTPLKNRRKVLRRFLFSCTMGLRKSDLYRVKEDWDINGFLTFVPHKGRKKNKILRVPFNKISRELWQDALREKPNNAKLFDDYEEQSSNRLLKTIAKELGIQVNLHHHVGRHTFITMYYNLTKDLLGAKEFAGHYDIRQTLVYTHFNPEDAKNKMAAMDNIIKTPPPTEDPA